METLDPARSPYRLRRHHDIEPPLEQRSAASQALHEQSMIVCQVRELSISQLPTPLFHRREIPRKIDWAGPDQDLDREAEAIEEGGESGHETLQP